MPGLRSLPDLVAQVRRRADMQNTQFVTDEEIEQYIQDSYGELYDLIIENAGVDHYRESLDFETFAGQSDYPLSNRLYTAPGDIFGDGRESPLSVYKVVAVDVQLQGDYRPIRPGRRFDHSGAEVRRPWGNPRDVVYHVFRLMQMGRNCQVVRFYPTPDSTYQVRLHYIPIPYDLDGDGSLKGDTLFQGFSGWDEYIVVDAAAKCLEKEESDARHLYKRKAELEARIRWHAQTMNLDGPGRVRNVDSGGYGNG